MTGSMNPADPGGAGTPMLGECYALAAQFATLEPARDVLRERAKRTPGKTASVLPGVTVDAAQTLSETVERLSHMTPIDTTDPLNDEDATGNMMAAAIQSIPPDNEEARAGETDFVLALISLGSSSAAQRMSALTTLGTAHAKSPHDPRITALAQAAMELGRGAR